MINITNPVVIARLTVSRSDGYRTIVEVRADATFHRFYHFFSQEGARWSTKQFIRSASRNTYLPAINAHLYQPGLDVVARQLESLFARSNPVTKVTLRIIKKRLYKRLTTVAADQLGLSKVGMPNVKRLAPTLYPRLIGKAVPIRKFHWPENVRVQERLEVRS